MTDFIIWLDKYCDYYVLCLFFYYVLIIGMQTINILFLRTITVIMDKSELTQMSMGIFI